MREATRHAISITVVLALLAGGAAAFVYSGFYDIGADDRHTAPVYAALDTMRERSIQSRASQLDVPGDLDDPARIRQGAGNYDAMCKGCHLAPAMAPTELSRGLYPAPPNLSRHAVDPAEAFWVIDHGIKASGMPAWGGSMDDAYIWNMVAFLQQLPGMDARQYQALVASSGGHSHGGGETQAHSHPEAEAAPTADAMTSGHDHPPGTPAGHHDAPAEPKPPGAAAPPAASEAASDDDPVADREHAPEPDMVEHRHADGSIESHPAPPPDEPADDGHDHQH